MEDFKTNYTDGEKISILWKQKNGRKLDDRRKVWM